MKLFKTNN